MAKENSDPQDDNYNDVLTKLDNEESAAERFRKEQEKDTSSLDSRIPESRWSTFRTKQ